MQLLKEPGGRDCPQQLYNREVKANICVVCGAGDDYVRHYVVPYAFRRTFPPRLKSHSSMDIVLLCIHCQEKSSQLDERYKRQLAARLGLTYTAGSDAYIVDAHLGRVKKAAGALAHRFAVLPPARREALLAIVGAYVRETEEAGAICSVDSSSSVGDGGGGGGGGRGGGGRGVGRGGGSFDADSDVDEAVERLDPVKVGCDPPSKGQSEQTEQMEQTELSGSWELVSAVQLQDDTLPPILVRRLEAISSMSVKRANAEYIPFEVQVCRAIVGGAGEDEGKQDEAINAFVEGWRQHFVGNMHPRHLPAHIWE